MLLIDEIDKTDQEFEAMLLEVLSEFQISIPELGVVEARTQPLVLLTSNNSRELTEALKRRCLYLWLDYPDVERELEIVQLHAPELDQAIARKLVEVVHMVRTLDLKKPPSIAESIDWARALLLLGAEDIDRSVLEKTMSIIVKHRTDLDLVAERVGVKLGDGVVGTLRPLAAASSRLGRLRRRNPALYGGMPAAPGPDGMAPRLLEFADELRREGVAVGTSELLDAFQALDAVSWTSRPDFHSALAATLAKSQEDRHVLDVLFDRFFFRAVEREAIEQGLREERFSGAQEIDLEALRERIREAVRAGNDGDMRDLARLAIAAFGRQGEGSGVIGVDVQRIRRTLGLKGENPNSELLDPDSVPRDQLQEFERHVRRELERQMIERTQSLPPAKPLREFDRALPTNPAQDLSQVHRVVAQMKKRLASHGREHRGRRRSWQVDVRRTMRASLQTGGVPLELKYRPKRPRRPELYVLCDVSTSVTSASVFFLSVLHALHDQFRKLRSFVFVERISEVTSVFERERSFEAVSRRIATDAGVADVSGYTDYGRVWVEFLDKVVDDLDPRSTVIVLGDARTNGREPHAPVFANVAERAGHTFWINPEPRLYWNYGDSVMSSYEPFCDGVFECWTTKQLETFVNAIAELRIGA